MLRGDERGVGEQQVPPSLDYMPLTPRHAASPRICRRAKSSSVNDSDSSGSGVPGEMRFVPLHWDRLPPGCLGNVEETHAVRRRPKLSKHTSVDFDRYDDDDESHQTRSTSASDVPADQRVVECWAWADQEQAQSMLCTIDRFLNNGGKNFSNNELWNAAWSGFGPVMRSLVWSTRASIALYERVDLRSLVRQRGIRRDDYEQLCKDVGRTIAAIEHCVRNFKVSLYQLLVAVAAYNPSFGYSQSMNMVAAGIILNVREQWRQFWLFDYFAREFLPHYWSRSNIGLLADERVLAHFVATRSVSLGKLVAALDDNMLVMLVCRLWFPRLFFGVLRPDNCFRLWDQLMIGGPGVLFEFALRILLYKRADIKRADSAAELFTELTAWLGALESLDELLYTKLSKPIGSEEVRTKRASALSCIALQRRPEQACYVAGVSNNPTPSYTNGGHGCLCARSPLPPTLDGSAI